MMMSLIFVAFAAFILYYASRFIQVLIKMRQKRLFPITTEEMASLRKVPGKHVKSPTFSSQKGGIIFYIFFLLYIITVFTVIWILRQDMIYSSFLLIIYPMFFSSNLLNLFVITKDGIVSSARFVSWRRIKSYEFKRIDVNHRYFGHSPEVNDRYELRLKTRVWTHHCIITTDETKEKINNVLEEQGIEQIQEARFVSENQY